MARFYAKVAVAYETKAIEDGFFKHRGLIEEYQQNFDQRREKMFREFAHRIHRVNPQFVFSAYHMFDTPVVRGLNTLEVPLFAIDHRHYWDDHTRPWWDSHYVRYHRELGMRHIAGTWDNSLFGGSAKSDVSAAQCMYDIAINYDGYWLWFEEELTPDVWRAFWITNRRIQATEQKVGKFLRAGGIFIL